MPLINPIYGLPNYSVDRLTESEGMNRQRDSKKSKKEEESKSNKAQLKDESPQEGDLSVEPSDASQPLDTETVVKLLEQQVKNQIPAESESLKATSLYDHVKKLTDQSKVNREI